MPRASYYKNMFFIGALWNWVATTSVALGNKQLTDILEMEPVRYPMFLYSFLGLAFIFGIGYYWVSRDINDNHPIVVMGIIGKFFVFAISLLYGILGEIPLLLVAPGVVDLIFGVLFVEFLITVKRTKKEA